MKIFEQLGTLNNKVALRVTLWMSTMACVYAFLILSLIPLAFPTLTVVCMYISSTVIQLVCLPLIMVGQNLMGKDQEKRSKEDHEALMGMMKEMHVLLEDADKEIDHLDIITTRLDIIEKKLSKY